MPGTGGWRRHCLSEGAPETRIMPDKPNPDRKNDTRLLTPLLLMAVLIACGLLYYRYIGAPPTTSG